MGIRTHVGCAGLRGPIETYARRFEVLELDVLDKEAPPKSAALRRWRKDAGPSLRISIVAPRSVAAARPGKALVEGLERLLEAQRVLEARHVLLATPTELTPSELQKERLAKVVDRIREGLGEAAPLVRVAWSPRGVWEPETAARFARKLDVDLALDPLADPQEPFFDDAVGYYRLSPVGGRTEFPPSRLRRLAEVLAHDARRTDVDGERLVVFATPHAPREAKRLRTLIEQLTTKTKIEGGAVIRPRGARVRDEEE